MKLVCCAILLLLCVFAQVQGNGESQGHGLTVDKHHHNCFRATYNSDHTAMTAVGCAEWRCAKGKQIGYHELDDSKPYPECCPGPICAE